MKAVLAFIGLLLIAVVLIGVTRGHSSDPSPTGNPAVFDRISVETDCVALQREFDIAESNHHTDYMVAADERMRADGCYSR
jgi:hypothetical protein